jgi:hypothetical protein
MEPVPHHQHTLALDLPRDPVLPAAGLLEPERTLGILRYVQDETQREFSDRTAEDAA